MSNADLIQQFYTCFQNKDFRGMQECYSDHAVFSDPVFVNLNATQVRAMWEMLCKRATDLRIEFSDVKADNLAGSAKWTAYYTFSATNKKVINKIDSKFRFENGKIVEHIDSFRFYNWAKQALGLPGLLLGWTGYLKSKLRGSAMKSLDSFIQKNKQAAHD